MVERSEVTPAIEKRITFELYSATIQRRGRAKRKRDVSHTIDFGNEATWPVWSAW